MSPKFNDLSFVFTFFICLIFLCSCSKKQPVVIKKEQKLFSIVPSKTSGIKFINQLTETVDNNYYQYSYTYIGGGVAAADFNNDGLKDLFFISNNKAHKFYLNQGNFKFKDITSASGIKKRAGFDTGVTVADVNNDGFLDLYISRGGSKNKNNSFANMLYINNGDLTFTEKAEELGLADTNRTIQATFFDYDNDNDLDVYISNTPDLAGKAKVLDLKQVLSDPKTINSKGCDRLYNNDGTGHFTDVSEKAGILYDIGFGLNPQVGDINNDGYLDIYICNDFNFPDLVYLNNGNGTFSESRNNTVKHMSFYSMGSDMADMNNDGLLDIMTLDMNPEDYVRSKTTMAMTSVDQFELMVNKDHHYQYMHNMLQLNNGNGTFSEIGNMSGIANTDWSWSLLSADFDLDGLNDIYITNGVFRDVMDRDILNKTLDILRENNRKPTHEDFLKFAKMLPQQKLNNYFFRNNGNLTFENTSRKWVDSIPTFSNGSVYADLDNDGDLDIVVNNINDEATVLKNNASESELGNYLKIKLTGPKNNINGIGATVKLHQSDGRVQIRQLVNTRGFLSSVSNTIHFGIPKNVTIKELEIHWLDNKHQTLQHVKPNRLLNISYTDANSNTNDAIEKTEPLFSKVSSQFKHEDPYFNDYSLQVLLPHKLSQTGPGLAKGDVNSDGLEDIYIGGGHNQPGQLLIGLINGGFKAKSILAFTKDKLFEDQSACFFDADNDGDMDLYVASGSYEFSNRAELLLDRLYINNGNSNFTRSTNQLPEISSSSSVVVPGDFDKDGDIDLFIGGRVIPGKYPNSPQSNLLVNTNGTFSLKTKDIAPELEHVGMVTDATWIDINSDQQLDLIVTGEWMGIEIFINQNNTLVKSKDYENLSHTIGWWNKILVCDIDQDGDKDIVAGNLGLNYKFKASNEKPFHVYTTDFDFNGTEDIILAKHYKGEEVPIRGKTCMTQQIPHLERKIPNYNDFASRNLEGILGSRIKNALHYEANEFRSGIFINTNGKFRFSPFENTIQRSPINSIIFDDLDSDGHKDLILAGNNYQSEVETTRADAGTGHVLMANAKGSFKVLALSKSGFFSNKDVRHLALINGKHNKLLFVANNNSYHDIFKLKK